jgi:hypothetical protein
MEYTSGGCMNKQVNRIPEQATSTSAEKCLDDSPLPVAIHPIHLDSEQ